jgi:hypothetical protein
METLQLQCFHGFFVFKEYTAPIELEVYVVMADYFISPYYPVVYFLVFWLFFCSMQPIGSFINFGMIAIF